MNTSLINLVMLFLLPLLVHSCSDHLCGNVTCDSANLACCNDSIEKMEVCYALDTDWCAYGNYLCALNNDVCGGFCINPVDAVCINSNGPSTGTLCGRGDGLCGTTCYNQVDYTCSNGALKARAVAATQLTCGTQSYNPSSQACCYAIGNNSKMTVCAMNELCCATTGSSGAVTSCYDPNESYCCTEGDGKICAMNDTTCCYGNSS